MKINDGIKQLIKGIFVGGLAAVISLISLQCVFVFSSQTPVQAFEFIIALVVLGASLLTTIWATGFWGRWGMLLFFIIVPIVLIIDYTVNPLFPSGVIVVASICYGSAKYKTGHV